MCFRSVQFVGPFSNSVVALVVIYKCVIEVVEEVKSIIDAILRNRKVLLDFGVHVVLLDDFYRIHHFRGLCGFSGHLSDCHREKLLQSLVVYLHCSPGGVTNANLCTYFICVDGGMISVRTASLCSLVFDESPDSARLTTPTVNEPMIRYKKD